MAEPILPVALWVNELASRFGAEWDAYCGRTGRLWPGSVPMIGPQL